MGNNNFACACKDYMRSACAGQQVYRQYQGKGYCVLHFPSEDKLHAFNTALQSKLERKDFNFRGAWFPDRVDWQARGFDFDTGADFTGAVFNKEVDFTYVAFGSRVEFERAEFKEKAVFREVPFQAASFRSVSFNAAVEFTGARFTLDADFTEAKFKGSADFTNATFKSKAEFTGALFSDYLKFSGKKGEGFNLGKEIVFKDARVERPERVSFDYLSLRPGWFIGLDTRKFNFINITWKIDIKKDTGDYKEDDGQDASGFYPLLPTLGRYLAIRIQKQKDRRQRMEKASEAEPPSILYPLLSITYRQLAVNAEENHEYEYASSFRYNSMDARRRERWLGLGFWQLRWLYWLASGYGEEIRKSLLMLSALILLFAYLYTYVGFEQSHDTAAIGTATAASQRDEIGMPLRMGEAIIYSGQVITFQKPEPRPLTRTARFLVTIELIIVPVQAAMLVLAVRRRFMR